MEQHRCYGCMQLHDGDFCPYCGWPVGKNNEPHQLPVGTVLRGQYEVGRVLGQGGFGITYLGWDRHLETAVCIKEYFPNHVVSRDCTVSTQVHCHTEAGADIYQASKERFLREGKVLAQFRDIPEIVSIYGFFEENDTVYIVMEYIKGMDLAHYVQHRGGRISADETFRILKPVMEALAQVHRSELVHRDIAPDNIMLHPRGGAKLLDFGAARMVENAGVDKGLDRSTEAIVKHGFAPMEQYQTRGNLGPWTDVYAMCATVYYCLTGQIPPEATTRMMGEADFSFAGIPGLTERQQYALEKGMAVLPKDRYTSMEELLDGLFGDAPVPMTYTEPVKTAPQPPKPEKQKKKSGKGLLIALGSVLAAAVIGIGGFFIATVLSDASFGNDAPALEAGPAPTATEAPMTEAPAVEVPAQRVPTFGLIGTDPFFEIFSAQLREQLEETGLGFTMTTHTVSSALEVIASAEQMIASGCDAIMVQGVSPHSEEGECLSAVTASCGIPLILLGDDPTYDIGQQDYFDDHPGVAYVGADPRLLGSYMVSLVTDMDPDRDGDGSIGYVFLGGESLTFENAEIMEAIPGACEMYGCFASALGGGYDSDCADILNKALLSYGDQVELIFCTDAEAAETAYMVCQEWGIDVWNEVTIVVLGSPEELQWMYEEGILAGYVEYSRELLADAAAEVLMATLWGGQTGGYYPMPCQIHIPE